MAEEVKKEEQKPDVWRIAMKHAGFYYKRKFYPCVRIPEGFIFETTDRHIKDYCLNKLGGVLIEE